MAEKKRELQILMIEDVPADRTLVSHELRRKGVRFKSTWVETREDFVHEMERNPPDLILSDHGLPSFDGLTALRIARSGPVHTPFIFVTNDKSEELAVKSLRDGASDYVLKERLSELVPAMTRALRVAEQENEMRSELRRLNAELEVRLEEQRGEWRRSFLEMETFSHAVSHDLRAPLIRIDGFVELLREYMGIRLGEMERHYLDTIGASAAKMGQMLDDLLAFSTMSLSAIRHVRIHLRKLVEDVVAELAPEEEGRKIEWIIGEMPEVFGDPVLLRAAVRHLLSNAIKFTRNCPRARVECGARSVEDEMIFFVRDNGAGFDMKYADRIFGFFKRLHPASEFEGNGVGLANVRRIIARHGGHTWAEGVPDQGATFSFSLPLLKEPPRDPVQTHSSG